MAITETDLETINFGVSLLSLALLLSARRYRKVWPVGNIPWVLLPLSFGFFAIREAIDALHPAGLLFIKPILGIWAAFLLLSAFAYLFLVLVLRLKISDGFGYIPFAFAAMPLIILLLLLYSGFSTEDATKVSKILEAAIWIMLSFYTVVFTYLIGNRAAGGFSRVYMLFQFAAYSAITWKILDLANFEYVEEFFESLFSLFSALAIFELRRMLIKLHEQLG